MLLTVIDQVPPVAVAVPRVVEPSLSVTVAPASAVPVNVTLEAAMSALSAGAVNAGAAGAAVSITKVCVPGVGSTVPAAFLARTSKVCVPSDSVAVVNGDVHAVYVPPSTRHSKLVPVPVKLNVGVLSPFGEPIGVSVVSGVDVSIDEGLGGGGGVGVAGGVGGAHVEGVGAFAEQRGGVRRACRARMGWCRRGRRRSSRFRWR